MLREDRRILRLAAGTIAIAKVSLRALQAPSFSAGLPAMARKSQARVSGVVSAEANRRRRKLLERSQVTELVLAERAPH